MGFGGEGIINGYTFLMIIGLNFKFELCKLPVDKIGSLKKGSPRFKFFSK